MKRTTKLWIRKRALMLLRAIVWRVDEWLHRQELVLRDEIAKQAPGDRARDRQQSRGVHPPTAAVTRRAPSRESFAELEARRNGISMPPGKKRRAARGRSAADFDRRFA